tara:strand:- start:347 stop:754 length:408 start_codon:yes stop_codon:yes gene_type:complete
MSDKIVSILSKFSREELAFFAKYKLPTYSLKTQEIIQERIRYINLDQQEIVRLISENEFIDSKGSSLKVCPRCNSDKLFIDQLEIYDHRSLAILDGDSFRSDIEKLEMKVCFVCGFNLSKDKKPRFLSRLFRRQS